MIAHRCHRKHRSARTYLACAFPDAAWITGDGEFALIAPCRVPTISLHKTHEDAEAAKAFIDTYGCGGYCRHSRHRIVHIDIEHPIYTQEAK